jgi:hypothetical protein
MGSLNIVNNVNVIILECNNFKNFRNVKSCGKVGVIVRVESGYLLNAYCPYVKGEHMYTDLNNIGLS